jgi:hypothetical protein
LNALLLVALALTDAAFAGFRAYTGRDGRIRKTAPALHAARRGATVGVLALALTTAVALAVLLAAPDRAARHAELDAAAARMLCAYVPFTAVVLAGLACYLWGPFRLSTLAVVVGLGPLTLLRPAVVLIGAGAAAWGSLPAARIATTGAAGVLLVGPLTRHRWYAAPV